MNSLVEKLRKDRGLNQEDLSKALKVSRQTITAIENGKYNPSLNLAFLISEFFELRIEEIFFPDKGGKKNEEK